GCGSGSATARRSRDVHCSKPRAIHSAVIARLDRAIQYAAASPSYRAVSGILDPRFRGDDSGGRFSLSDANELEQGGYPMNIRSNPDTTLPAVTTGPLPSSRKIFAIPDAATDVRVPLREIILSEGAGEPNLPVYDTSGPYTDPDVTIDVNAGLKRARIEWVKERGGVEEYEGRDIKPEDNGNVGASHAAKAFTAHHKPLRGLDGHMITQLEFARAGIITKEMIYVATRENLGRKQQLERAEAAIADGNSFGASVPAFVTPEFVRSEIARGRAIIPCNINHGELEPMLIGRNFLT